MTHASAPTFLDLLIRIREDCDKSKEIALGHIFEILAGRGYGAMLILLSFPFCIPVQIPGFSTPFGVLLAIIGLRIAFIRHPWWPNWIVKKKFDAQRIGNLLTKVIRAVKWFQKALRPRYAFLVTKPIFRRMHGILIFFLGVLLALPLPIPFTNLIFAVPIFCIGLGLLEDDGVAVFFGYFLTLVAIIIFFFLFRAAGSLIGLAIS